MTEALLGDYLKNAESTLWAVPSRLEGWSSGRFQNREFLDIRG